LVRVATLKGVMTKRLGYFPAHGTRGIIKSFLRGRKEEFALQDMLELLTSEIADRKLEG
jgi:hypothetical protein